MQEHNINIEILGKVYKIKCPAEHVQSLQEAAAYVEREMRKVRDGGKVIGLDRVAIITALNIAYQLLNEKEKENQGIDEMSTRIYDMQKRIEEALTQREQIELPAE